MEISGNTFIVTGGASGLGAATTRMLNQAGARVVVADLKEAEGKTLADSLGESVQFVGTDVCDEGICLAPACGSDSQCSGAGQACTDGKCTTAVVPSQVASCAVTSVSSAQRASASEGTRMSSVSSASLRMYGIVPGSGRFASG